MMTYPDVKRRLQTMTMTLLAPFYFLKAGTYIEFGAAVSGAGLIAVLFFVKVIAKIAAVFPLARYAFRHVGAVHRPRNGRDFNCGGTHCDCAGSVQAAPRAGRDGGRGALGGRPNIVSRRSVHEARRKADEEHGSWPLRLPESRGSIVYTPSNSSCSVELGNSCSFNIDVNNDGLTDFTINVAYGESHCAPHCVYDAIAAVQPALGNGVIANTYGWASPLVTGTKIGSREPFYYAGALMADVGEYILHGYWLNVGPHFLGLAFMVSGKTYYGWARLSVKAPRGVHGQGAITTKLTGYAYETKSGESIKAGQK
jgi:hypothetical protein